jgi:bifunctional DNA-binding transcriptional regulator/antitoxin component of YhaV-PrlF toxin-antitoxin module
VQRLDVKFNNGSFLPILYILNKSKGAAILYLLLNSKEDGHMPKVSSKRQITLPVEQCQQAGIEPGNEVQCFVADGHITIVKKIPGAARASLRHVKGDTSVTDEESLQSALGQETA